MKLKDYFNPALLYSIIIFTVYYRYKPDSIYLLLALDDVIMSYVFYLPKHCHDTWKHINSKGTHCANVCIYTCLIYTEQGIFGSFHKNDLDWSDMLLVSISMLNPAAVWRVVQNKNYKTRDGSQWLFTLCGK